jgi:magnesium chelatase family protein
MTEDERIQTAVIYSAAGKSTPGSPAPFIRPFRNPHCTIGRAGLIGGGNIPVPGEITLAHNGVLFMDEACEYDAATIEALRTPIEEKQIVHFRKGESYVFPCDFQLIMAANPCPCGFYGEGDRCTCSPSRRIAYLSRLSGPIIDRIDIQIWMHPIESRKLVERPSAEPSAVVAQRVLKARDIQRRRFAEEGIFCNAAMNNRMIEKYCPLDDGCKILLERLIDRMGLSARACTRIVKLARTIADLAGVPDILPEHISEAAGYRFLDRQSIL